MEQNTLNRLSVDIESIIKEATEAAIIPEIMNVKQASILTHLSKTTLYSKVCKGEIPYKKKGKRLLFIKKELENWMLND